MAVLVTGGAGYIGSHMVLELLAAGERVVVLDNFSTGFRDAVPGDVVLVEGDFGDEALVSGLIREHGVDAIAHFAAKIVVPDSSAAAATSGRQSISLAFAGPSQSETAHLPFGSDGRNTTPRA